MSKLVQKENLIIKPYYIIYIVYCGHTQEYNYNVEEYFKRNKVYTIAKLKTFAHSNQQQSYIAIYNEKYINKYGIIDATAGKYFGKKPGQDEFINRYSIRINDYCHKINDTLLPNHIINGTLICASSYQPDCNDYAPRLLKEQVPGYEFKIIKFINEDNQYYDSHFDRIEYFYWYEAVKLCQTKRAIKN